MAHHGVVHESFIFAQFQGSSIRQESGLSATPDSMNRPSEQLQVACNASAQLLLIRSILGFQNSIPPE